MFAILNLNKDKGAIITLVVVFSLIFLILLGGLLNFILFQLKTSAQRLDWNRALHIAEAGIDYYRWCLNHNLEGICPSSKDYFDSQGNLIGSFSLDITSTLSCGETIKKEIVATGWTNRFSDIKRKVKVTYGRVSVGRYAYLLNDNVWAGGDREISGLYHSNGGIRMDGENQSLVTSAQETWLCTSSFGCDYWDCPTDCSREGYACRCPGVFTTTGNSNPDLFDFPVPSFDFDGITVDLANIKNIAQTSGIYLPPSTDIDPSADGYHIKFRDSGDIEVWIITKLSRTWAYSLEEGWHYDYFIISNEYLYNLYSLNPDCSLIFIEDNLWPEGTVKGKVAIASANLINPNKDTDVVLQGNIDYTTLDGSDGFALIGERNVLISPNSPNNMELRGIYVAQKGHFGRNHYWWNIKDKLEIIGSIVSNGRVGTKWGSGGSVVSGYLKRENYIDPKLIYNPPPFVPYVSADFHIVDWEEIE